MRARRGEAREAKWMGAGTVLEKRRRGSEGEKLKEMPRKISHRRKVDRLLKGFIKWDGFFSQIKLSTRGGSDRTAGPGVKSSEERGPGKRTKWRKENQVEREPGGEN